MSGVPSLRCELVVPPLTPKAGTDRLSGKSVLAYDLLLAKGDPSLLVAAGAVRVV